MIGPEKMKSNYLAETVEKAQSLIDRLSNTNADPQIGSAVQAMLTELVERPHELTRASFDPFRLAVQAMLKKHGVAYEDRELSSITLAELDDVSMTADELNFWLPEGAR